MPSHRREVTMSASDIAKATRANSGIPAAITGSSSAMQTLGNIGSDPKPEVMLAVGLAHTHDAIAALIEEVTDLRREVDALKRRGRSNF